MKHPKLLILAVTIAMLSTLVFATAYNSLVSNVSQVKPPEITSHPLLLQFFSPKENYTYGTYNGPLNSTTDQAAHEATYNLILPLNITANQETSRITYSLDGSDNITFNENTTTTLTLNYGVHSLTAYATNIEGIASKSNITFTVGYDYPLNTKITMEQVQEATRYFESRGLKVQAEVPIDESKWQNLVYFLYAGSVDFVSKENFADAVIAHGMDTIWVYQDSNQVSFYIKVYGNSWFHALPTVYSYGATLV
jgi:hypothetical protein